MNLFTPFLRSYIVKICNLKKFTLYSLFALALGALPLSAQHRLSDQAPEDPEEKFTNAQREMLIGRSDKAITIYEELYREDRENAAVAFELAKAYYQKKDLLLTEKYAKLATEKAPTNRWMAAFFASFLSDTGRPAQAALIYQKLATDYPYDREFYQLWVDNLLLDKKEKEAILVYDAMERSLGADPEIYLSRFELYAKTGAKEAAVAQLNALISKYPAQKTYLKTKAAFLGEQGKKEEALALYREVLAIDPEDTDANLAVLSVGEDKEKPNAYLMALMPVMGNPSVDLDKKIGELLPYIQNLANGGNQEVKTALLEIGNKLILTHPEDARAYSLYGDVLFHTGNMEGAIQRYEQTLQRNKKIFSVWDQLMYAYFETNDIAKLGKLSSDAIDYFPNQPSAYFYNSVAAAWKKDFVSAVEMANEGLIVAGGNEIHTARLQVGLALGLAGKNDFVAAKTAIDKAMAISKEKYAFAYEAAGDLAQVQGNSAEAQIMWQKSKDMGNLNRSLLQKLQVPK